MQSLVTNLQIFSTFSELLRISQEYGGTKRSKSAVSRLHRGQQHHIQV